MKILLLSPLPPSLGGITSWTVDYIEWCKENNIDLNVVDTGVKGSRLKDFNKINYIQEIKRNLNIVHNANKALKEKKYDIVHINTPCSAKGLIRDYLVALKAKKHKVKVVLHCRCNVPDWVKGKFGKFIFNKVLKQTDQIITLNSSSKDFIKSQFNKDSIILPNYIKNVNKSLCVIKPEIKNILFVGHLLNDKGIREIAETAKMFPEYNFDLIGNISNEAEELNKPNNMAYLGEMKKSQVLEKMAKYDVFLFPTYTEGFPNVITEAMSTGIPIIASGVGAIPDMIADGLGIIIKEKDIDSIINALNTIKNQDLRTNMSKKCIDKVNECYLISKVLPKLISIYEELL